MRETIDFKNVHLVLYALRAIVRPPLMQFMFQWYASTIEFELVHAMSFMKTLFYYIKEE